MIGDFERVRFKKVTAPCRRSLVLKIEGKGYAKRRSIKPQIQVLSKVKEDAKIKVMKHKKLDDLSLIKLRKQRQLDKRYDTPHFKGHARPNEALRQRCESMPVKKNVEFPDIVHIFPNILNKISNIGEGYDNLEVKRMALNHTS